MGPRAPVWLVERMVVAAIGLVQAYTDRLMRALGPLLEARYGPSNRAPPERQDAATERPGAGGSASALDDIFARVQEGELSHGFLERMFHMVDRQAAEDLQRVVPVSLGDVLPHATQMREAWIDKNSSLIRLEERAQKEVRAIITAPITEGVRVEEIRAQIQERMGVVRSRAELIARDQTLKLYGQVQEQRQTEAGIVEYTWSTSQDERVRHRHSELEGTTQRWDTPPVVDPRTGRREHPGGDFSCRCAAIPILSGDEPPPESESRPSRRLQVEPANDVPELPEAPEATSAGGPPEPPAPPSEPPSKPPSEPPPSEPLLATRERYTAHLESRGFRAVNEGTFQAARAVMGDVSASELDAIIGSDAFAGIPGVRRTEFGAGSRYVRFGVEISPPTIDPVRLFRTFHTDTGELVAYHDRLELPKELQGAGIGRRLLRAQVTAYERMGVARIDLDAEEIGSYYWPKLGFDCPPDDLRRYAAEFVLFLRGAGLDAAVVRGMTDDIQTLRDIAITELAEHKLGKEFLLQRKDSIPNLYMSMKSGSEQLAIMKRELGL
jgi:SPP1 gp7 family putative phage head morphogenesis protein